MFRFSCVEVYCVSLQPHNFCFNVFFFFEKVCFIVVYNPHYKYFDMYLNSKLC